MSSLLRLERQQKDFLKPIMNLHIIPFSYSFGIETTNTFIRSRGFLENHTRFKTKMGKVYILFRTETTQKPYPPGLRIHLSAYPPIVGICFKVSYCFAVLPTFVFNK